MGVSIGAYFYNKFIFISVTNTFLANILSQRHLQFNRRQFNISNQMIQSSIKSQTFDQVLKKALHHLKDNQRCDILGKTMKHNYLKANQFESQGFTWFSQNSDIMAFTQSEYSLNFAFSSNSFDSQSYKRVNSQKGANFKNEITIYTFLRETGEHLCKKLNPIYKNIYSLCFSFDKELSQLHPIYLLCGTSCGILCVITFHQSKIQLNQFQCSYFSINQIIDGIWPQTSFILCKDQSVLLVNYISKTILMQTKGALLPLDSPLSIKISYDDNFILQSSTYGTIRLWKFGEQVISAIGKSGKAFVSKPYLTISSLSPKGLKWCDFLGQFIVLITSDNYLKIAAISHNLVGQAEQNFQVITCMQLLSNEKQQVLDAECHPFKRIITVSKRNSKKFYIQAYLFNQQYEIISITKIQFPELKGKIFEHVSFTEDMNFLCLREKSGFAIGHDEQIYNQAVEDSIDGMSESTKDCY